MLVRILVVSGFLGAGKTTFIQELVRRTGQDVVIYENEYGEADVDARRLRDDSDLKVWESVENCICCSGKQDFASSVLTISNTLDPKFLVVEPTGVAKLGNVMDNLTQVSWERIELLPPVTIVDAQSWQNQRRRQGKIFDDQLRAAGTVVVSKIRAVDDADPVVGLVRELNPKAQVVGHPYGELPDAWWAALLEPGDGGHERDSRSRVEGNETLDETPELETLALDHAELPSPSHLLWVLDALSAGVFGHLARAKGSLPCGGQWLRFDLVERAWAVTGDAAASGAPTESHCVFIGDELRRSWLREVFVPALWRDVAEIRHEHHHDHERHHE